jgi:hypothetical protein
VPRPSVLSAVPGDTSKRLEAASPPGHGHASQSATRMTGHSSDAAAGDPPTDPPQAGQLVTPSQAQPGSTLPAQSETTHADPPMGMAISRRRCASGRWSGFLDRIGDRKQSAARCTGGRTG